MREGRKDVSARCTVRAFSSADHDHLLLLGSLLPFPRRKLGKILNEEGERTHLASFSFKDGDIRPDYLTSSGEYKMRRNRPVVSSPKVAYPLFPTTRNLI